MGDLHARYVALGDSTTEGLDDPGRGPDAWVGFADRLALTVARTSPGLLYANLGIRGRKMGQVRAEQLGPALAMDPTLATVTCGINDLLRRNVDVDGVLGDLEAMVSALRGQGATVVGLTYPDLGTIMPLARMVSGRLAVFNEGVRTIAKRHGALVADLGRDGIIDRRLWSADLLHANADGHARIAGMMAVALGLEPDADPWAPLGPDPGRPRGLAAVATARWAVQDMGPWVVRRARGRSSGDGREPKRPTLAPVDAYAVGVNP